MEIIIKGTEPKRVTDYIKGQSQNQTLKKIRYEYLLSIVQELIEKGILIISHTGKLAFLSDKLPKEHRVIYNGKNKVILAIKSFCQ